MRGEGASEMGTGTMGISLSDRKLPNPVGEDDDPIDNALRQLYNATIEEPLPSEFLDLLDQIDRKIQSGEARK